MSDAPSAADRIRELYRAEFSAVARHLRALTRDESALEDLVHETFLRAYRALDSFDGRSSLRTWVHGIAVNVARNYRTKHRRRLLAQPEVEQRPPHGPQPSTPEEDALRDEALRRFYTALDDLRDEEREAFVLHILEQLPLKETAAILDLPVSTVHARAQRAASFLRQRVEERT